MSPLSLTRTRSSCSTAPLASTPPAKPASTVTAVASAVSGTDGSDCANASMRASVVLTVTKMVRLYATEASTGRPRASTATITKAARSASPTKIGLKAPGVVAFLRAISWATAMGEVGSFAISSARNDSGWTHANPTRETPAPARPITNTVATTSTGAARSLDRWAVTTSAKGAKSEASSG
jgi:hypothetical protein